MFLLSFALSTRQTATSKVYVETILIDAPYMLQWPVYIQFLQTFSCLMQYVDVKSSKNISLMCEVTYWQAKEDQKKCKHCVAHQSTDFKLTFLDFCACPCQVYFVSCFWDELRPKRKCFSVVRFSHDAALQRSFLRMLGLYLLLPQL